MTEKPQEPKTVSYSIVGMTGTTPGIYVQIPIEVSAKGLKRFTIDLDEIELDGTGVKTKNGIPVHYMIFKIVK